MQILIDSAVLFYVTQVCNLYADLRNEAGTRRFDGWGEKDRKHSSIKTKR